MTATAAVRNEQTKLLAGAINNLGVATVTTGGIGPIVAYFVGSLDIDDPLRLASFIVVCLFVGGLLLLAARRVLEDLE